MGEFLLPPEVLQELREGIEYHKSQLEARGESREQQIRNARANLLGVLVDEVKMGTTTREEAEARVEFFNSETGDTKTFEDMLAQRKRLTEALKDPEFRRRALRGEKVDIW